MKKEINELLNEKDGKLYINAMFRLRHEMYKDWFGKNQDKLYLETKEGWYQVEIESRDFPEIIDEVANGMSKILKEIEYKLTRSWRGGLINEYIFY